MNLCGVNIDDGRTHVIAELSNNANGKLENALRLIAAAKDAGASFVKTQCYSADELVALRGDGPAPAQWGEAGWSMHALYSKAMTPREWFAPMFAFARVLGIPMFASVFGLESLAMMEALGSPMHKIARLDNHHADLITACKATGKPVIVSACADSNPHYYSRGSEKSVGLYCPPGYPQETFALSHDRFTSTDESWDDPYHGFSYHGTSIEPCVMAATLGAKLLEVHVQLDDEPSELEANVSLTCTQLAELVTRTRDVERWRG